MVNIEKLWSTLFSINFFKFKSWLKFSICICFFFIIFFQKSLVFALDWDDEKWSEAGCPSNIFGAWISKESEAKI
jgi:hypothetical protein